MRLSRKDIQLLNNALAQLSGRAEQATDGDGKPTLIQKPYDLSGRAIYAAARNRAHLRPIAEVIQESSNAIVRKHADEKGNVPTGKLAACQAELNELMRTEEEVTLHRLPIAELKIETNKLAPDIVAGLLPILDGEIA